NWLQALLLARLRIDEIGPALRSVVVATKVLAVDADPVDHPGLEIGDEKLLVPAVVGDVAERRAGILPAFQRDRRKQARLIAVRRVEAVDGARTAGSEHAGHPLRIVHRTMQPESR